MAGLAERDWPEADKPVFFNINDRDALDDAARMLRLAEGTLSCSA